MARPREFDETAALDAAMHCFWARGYEATSVRDLACDMGLTSASLYNAFGDKRALYRRALDHYLEQSVHERIGRLEASLSPRDAIAAFLQEVIERSLNDTQRRGCMLVNSALELAPHDADLRRVVAQELAQIEAFFRRCVQAAQRTGEITTTQSAEDLARVFLGMLLGIRVLARSRPQRTLLEGIVGPVLSMLQPAPSARRPRRKSTRPPART